MFSQLDCEHFRDHQIHRDINFNLFAFPFYDHLLDAVHIALSEFISSLLKSGGSIF